MRTFCSKPEKALVPSFSMPEASSSMEISGRKFFLDALNPRGEGVDDVAVRENTVRDPGACYCESVVEDEDFAGCSAGQDLCCIRDFDRFVECLPVGPNDDAVRHCNKNDDSSWSCGAKKKKHNKAHK